MASYLDYKDQLIITLLCGGMMQSEIAKEIDLSKSAVEKRIKNLRKKYDAKTMFDLALKLPLAYTHPEPYIFTISRAETYMAETRNSIYFRTGDGDLVMYRKLDLLRFTRSEWIEEKLRRDIDEGKVEKIAPAAIEYFQALQKELQEIES